LVFSSEEASRGGLGLVLSNMMLILVATPSIINKFEELGRRGIHGRQHLAYAYVAHINCLRSLAHSRYIVCFVHYHTCLGSFSESVDILWWTRRVGVKLRVSNAWRVVVCSSIPSFNSWELFFDLFDLELSFLHYFSALLCCIKSGTRTFNPLHP
jgi:hypothetical protein